MLYDLVNLYNGPETTGTRREPLFFWVLVSVCLSECQSI